MKTLKHLFTAAGITMILFSCKPDSELYSFPITLYPVEVSQVSDVRMFIGGQEVFDKALCNSFIMAEKRDVTVGNSIIVLGVSKGNAQIIFDRSSFLNTSIINLDTRIMKQIRFNAASHFEFHTFRIDTISADAIVKNGSQFLFFFGLRWNTGRVIPDSIMNLDNILLTKYSLANSTELSLNYPEFVWTLNGVAYGTYNNLEMSILNYRYVKIRDSGYEVRTGRCSNEINSDFIASMQPTDTLVYQEYKIRYKP